MRKVGEYELIQKIGAGGMGEVWMAKRAVLGGAKVYAVKLLAGQHANAERQRELFVREARISCAMEHQNIVGVLEAAEHEGEAFMVMQWVDGMNLGQLMKALSQDHAALSLRATAFVVGQILRGLSYAHTLMLEGGQRGVIHRDISPQNVLLSVSGEVKLADFGVARVVAEETSGELRGKLGYLAPEQLQGGKLDARVDLYGVGVLLHELADGQRYRQARDHNHMYGLVMRGELAPLRKTKLPAELEQLRRGLLAPDPASRIASAAEALELLATWPGYADASLELARSVGKYAGVDAPRSGIHAAASASASYQATSDPAALTRTSTAAPSVSAPGESSLSAAVTRTSVPAEPAQERPLAARGRAWFVPAALAGALIAVAGAYGLVSEEQAATETSERTPRATVQADAASPEASEPATPAAKVGPMPTPAHELAAEPPVEAERAAQAQPGPAQTDSVVHERAGQPQEQASGPTPTPAPKSKATKPGVVDMHAGPYNFAYLKVGGRRLLLEPSERGIKLKPGRHRVSVSFELDGKSGFERAGSITVEPGKRYELRLKKPLALSFRVKR
jgi:serine/threonine protein kinase